MDEAASRPAVAIDNGTGYKQTGETSNAESFCNDILKVYQSREHIPPEDSFEVARKVREMYCYTCSVIVKEFGKHDRKPSKYIKQWTGVKLKTGAPYSCDIGYERYLGPEACHTKAEYDEYGASICRANPVFKGMY